MNPRSTAHLFLLSCTIATLLAGLGGCNGKGHLDDSGVNRTGGPGMPGTGGAAIAQPPKDSSTKTGETSKQQAPKDISSATDPKDSSANSLSAQSPKDRSKGK